MTTAGIQTPVMSIQESKDQGVAGAARTEMGEAPGEETASVPTALNQTAPPSYGTAKKDAPAIIPTPIPDSKVEPEGVDLDQTTTSIASGPAESHNDTELSGVMKDFPEIPTSAPTSGETRRSKPHVPPITIPVYNGVGHVDDWIELVLADAVAGHWTEATCRNVWMRYLGENVKAYLRIFPAQSKATFKQVCHLLIQRYGACRNVTAVRSRFRFLKQAKTEKPEEFLDRVVNQRMLGRPNEATADRESESIQRFTYNIEDKRLSWWLHDRVEWHQANGKEITLKDFRVLLMTHVAGSEIFDYERAGVDSLDERMQAKLPSYGTPLAAAAVEVREPLSTAPVVNSSNAPYGYSSKPVPRTLPSAPFPQGWQRSPSTEPATTMPPSNGGGANHAAPPLPAVAPTYSAPYPPRDMSKVQCRICHEFGHIARHCTKGLPGFTEQQRKATQQVGMIEGEPRWKTAQSMLLKDCQSALQGDTAPRYASDGSTFPQIKCEVQEIPGEDQPTETYVNWVALRLDQIRGN